MSLKWLREPQQKGEKLDRRDLLRGGVLTLGGVAASSLTVCAPRSAMLPPPQPVNLGPYSCGVASGVHSDTAVVLWTRFGPASVGGPVEVSWQVATDPSFTRVALAGVGVGSAQNDGCVKVLAQGLTPGQTYWYRFSAAGLTSPTGRTKTLPASNETPPTVRLAVASCQNFGAGYYSAWRAIAAEELDAVVFLGDYIYEYKGGSNPLDARPDLSLEATDLPSYRAKYKMYRSDLNLQAAHAAHPFAPVWDDHELFNDYDRISILTNPARAEAAYQAWFDYMPVWRIDADQIYRRARWGTVLDLSLLDTRQYRDPHITGPDGERLSVGSSLDLPLSQVHDSGRTILGTAQRDWLLDGFGQAQSDNVTWKFVANQVMITPTRILDLDEPALRAIRPDIPKHAGVYANFDDWSGYSWERDQLTQRVAADGISNLGFLTGDIHSFWQSQVRRDFDEPFSPVVAQEFVCGSISSRGIEFAGDFAPALEGAVSTLRPGFRYADFRRRGFGWVECTPTHARVEYRTVNTLTPDLNSPSAQPKRRVRFDWPAGTQKVSITRG
ncbi:MAG: alkaline phosphatase D family protein [Microthrixaceae bacterium]